VTQNGVAVDQAYVDIGNLAQSPFMLRVGKQYLPFGNYQLDAITPSLTQQLSETRGTAAQLAFVSDTGLHAAVYTFKGLQSRNTPEPDDHTEANHPYNINNAGASLGYTNLTHKIGFDLGAGYLYNMANVGTISQYIDTYKNRVGGLAAHATMMTGPFTLGVKYVSAIGKFSSQDLAYIHSTTVLEGASPSAGNITGSLAFKTYGYDSKLTGSYQWSKQAYNPHTGEGETTADFALPENRWSAEYDINVLENTMLGLEFRHDSAYGNDNKGSGKDSNTGTLRLSVLL
jgi:hypothetical protein